jgi:hypothetical protein
MSLSTEERDFLIANIYGVEIDPNTDREKAIVKGLFERDLLMKTARGNYRANEATFAAMPDRW